MRYFLLITLIFGFLKPVFPVFQYAVNYDYIVAELCEQKAVTNNTCNGKCHLKKELAKASTDQDDQKKQDSKLEKVTVEHLFLQNFSYNFTSQIFGSLPKIHFPNYVNLYDLLAGITLLQPPQQLV